MKSRSRAHPQPTHLDLFAAPSAEEQLRFLQNVQRILTEGQFVSSYKYALLHALTDLAVLQGDDSGRPLMLSIREIVERMAELYWPQAAPFDGTTVLRQSTADPPALLEDLQAAREEQLGSLYDLSAAGARWRRILYRSTRNVGREPIPRLQRIGREELPFLYDRGPAGHITLKPGVAFCLRVFRGLITELVQSAWVRFIRRRNPELEPGPKDLSAFLFGTPRRASAEVREELWELQKGRCFYCERPVKDGEVDHFIPWSLYPNDLPPNLVLADPNCNLQKSDMLAAERHLERWNERVALHPALAGVTTTDEGSRDPSILCRRVARWAYSAASRGGSLVWVSGSRLEPLGDKWRVLLPESNP